jgi:hypothetical protein
MLRPARQPRGNLPQAFVHADDLETAVRSAHRYATGIELAHTRDRHGKMNRHLWRGKNCPLEKDREACDVD